MTWHKHGQDCHRYRDQSWLYSWLLFFLLVRAALLAYGSSPARDQIGASVVDLRHSHRNAGSEPSLLPTPQLTGLSLPDA